MMNLLSFISALLFGASSLVIGITNPIHSILLLIFVFFLGSLLLFVLQLEYFALLFLIVYVGAIVVLFLFIVMMLEIRTLNVTQKFQDLFAYRSWILVLLAFEFFFILSQGLVDIVPLFSLFEEESASVFFRESNLYTNFGTLLQRTDHLSGIGGVLFTEYKFALILASILLLLSMIGSIVMTLDSVSFTTIKVQNANLQSLRQPILLGNSYRMSLTK
jgi:NADH:ubiquinone oxidoreductase subunit 6 (subunit J)